MSVLDVFSGNECGVNSNNHNATNFLKCFIYVFIFFFIFQEASSQYVAQTSSNLSISPASVSLASGTTQITEVTMQNS